MEFLSWCKDHSSILACLARSASSQQVILNSSISWQYLVWCSRKSQFLLSNSPCKLILSLFEIDLIKSNIPILFSHRLTSTSASASYSLSKPVFLLSGPIHISVQRCCGGFCLSPDVCTTFRSRSLFSFERDSKRLVKTVSRSMSAQVSLMRVRPTTQSRPVNTFVRLVLNTPSFDKVGTLLAALRSGVRRVVLLRETHVSGRKVDRRVLAINVDAELGIATCLMVKSSCGQKIKKYVSFQIPFDAWRRWMTGKMQLKDEKVRCKNSKCHLLVKNCWESMVNQLISSGLFSQVSRHCRFFRKSRMICDSGT